MCLKKNQVFLLAAVFFTIAALLHLLRLIFNWQAVIGAFAVPYWVSVIGVIVAGYLAYEFWRMK